jgi:hypothetical protein
MKTAIHAERIPAAGQPPAFVRYTLANTLAAEERVP